MAEFARYGYAIAEAINIGGDRFIRAYYKNMEEHNRQVVESNAVSNCLMQFIRQQIDCEWSGMMNDLLIGLNSIYVSMEHDPKNKNWPATASHLSRLINRVKVNIEGLGLKIDIKRTSKGSHIDIKYVPPQIPSSASLSESTESCLADSLPETDEVAKSCTAAMTA